MTKARKEQRKRRRQRQNRLPAYQKHEFELIDGNMTHYPVAYCDRMEGWLSVGLMDVHKCREKECHRLQEGVLYEG